MTRYSDEREVGEFNFAVVCIRCEEIVAEQDTDGGMCSSCMDQAHERQEMYR